MSSSQIKLDFLVLGNHKSVNFQEAEGAKFPTTTDTELLQTISLHFKWLLEGGLNVDKVKGQCQDTHNHFYEK